MPHIRSKTAPATLHDDFETPPIAPEYHDEAQTRSPSSDSSTNSSDEFWEDAAKEAGEVKIFDDLRAKRGRWLYLSFMRLYRPVRILLIATIVSGILITPYIVFKLSFPNLPTFPHVRAWSIWFTVSWACMVGLSILVDTLPRLIIYVYLTLLGKPRDRLTIELEAYIFLFSPKLQVAKQVVTDYPSSSGLAQTHVVFGYAMDCSVSNASYFTPSRLLLDYNQQSRSREFEIFIHLSLLIHLNTIIFF